MEKIYITGVPGIGKSTIVEEINKRGIFAFDIDFAEGLCAWRNKKTGKKIIGDSQSNLEWLNAHDWVCNAEKLKQLLSQDKEIIIAAGIAGNQEEYLHLFDKIFLLQCREATFLHRQMNRKGHDEFGKFPEERQYVLNFYKEFEQKIIARGATVINAEEPLEKVVDDIISKI